jgi:hypothetical protein
MIRAGTDTPCFGWLRTAPLTPTTPQKSDATNLLDRALAEAERRDSARSSLAPSTRSPTTPRVAATPPWNAPQTPSALEPAAGSCSLTGVNLALEAFALESPSPVRPQPNPPTPERGLRDRTNTPPRRAVPRPKRRRVPMHLPMPVLE